MQLYRFIMLLLMSLMYLEWPSEQPIKILLKHKSRTQFITQKLDTSKWICMGTMEFSTGWCNHVWYTITICFWPHQSQSSKTGLYQIYYKQQYGRQQYSTTRYTSVSLSFRIHLSHWSVMVVCYPLLQLRLSHNSTFVHLSILYLNLKSQPIKSC